MKTRFTTVDIIATLRELREKVLGMRVVNVYDVDHKTYLIKISRSEEKAFIIFESGVRVHLTEFEWPKNMMPSGFSMKCRKHLKSRRLVSIEQLGVDRIIDMQFGSDEAAYHLIVELYDKGNVILTDYQYVILNLLRTRTDQEAETRFAVRELYPKDAARQAQPLPSISRLQEILCDHSASDNLRKSLMPHLVYGSALLDHALIGAGFDDGALIGNLVDTLPRLQKALEEAEMIFQQLSIKEYQSCIIQKKQGHDSSVANDSAIASSDLVINVEFHPIIYRQHESMLFTTYQSFNKAVDEFYSKLNIQKIDVKLHQQEKAGLKKLENVRKDHSRRLQELERVQTEDVSKAELIELNIELVAKACDIINGAIASAMDWGDIVAMVKEARSHGDVVACAIHELQLERNHMILLLCNPYDDDKGKGVKVDIDLDLTAHANVRKYYDHKRFAVNKQQKTIDASSKALKSAERKTRQALKEASKVATIKKARKVYWFEKFYWFISSENYLVIGGRDQQQNELIVKKYLIEGDVYVHADLHGASSIVIKNPSKEFIPSRTLSEAATMATCYSSAWEAKVTSSVWWVWQHQVSKTAPSGEYLTTGSFMIRGKKNYLPPTQLMLCFGFMFKLDEDSVKNHHGDRQVKNDDDTIDNEVTNVAMEIVAMESDDLSSDNDTTENLSSNVSMVAFPDTIIGLTSSHGNRVASRQVEQKERVETKEKKKVAKKLPNKEEVVSNKQQHETTKRGQKYKQKKIKERYKDQDEEDRQLRMKLLASAGTSQQSTAVKNKKKKSRDSPSAKYKVKHSNSNLVEVTNKQQDPILMHQVSSPDHVMSSEGLILDHMTSKEDHVLAKQDHMTTEQDCVIIEGDDVASQDHVIPEQDRVTLHKNHVTSNMTSGHVHVTSQKDHVTSEDHVTAEQDVTSKEDNISTLKQDSSTLDQPDTSHDNVVAVTVEQVSEHDHMTSEKDHQSNDQGADNHGSDQGSDHNDQDSDHNDQDSDHNDQGSDHDDDEDGKDNITSLLDTLTGCPSNDDILLFAVPVCAPYMALNQYKYKVKIIPGIQRRGKAARTALHNFIRSKEVTSHEKDLLLSVKDNDLSRYFPGKVKMLATSTTTKSKHK